MRAGWGGGLRSRLAGRPAGLPETRAWAGFSGGVGPARGPAAALGSSESTPRTGPQPHAAHAATWRRTGPAESGVGLPLGLVPQQAVTRTESAMKCKFRQ